MTIDGILGSAIDMTGVITTADVEEVLWSLDVGGAWEVELYALVRTSDGFYHFLTAGGCSCWPYRSSATVQDSCADRRTALGAFFVPSNVKEMDPAYWSDPL